MKGHPSTTVKVREADLLRPARRALQRRSYRTRAEVPVNGKIVDLVGIGPDGSLLALELKLRHWRDALYQAFIHTTWSNLVYVGLPEEREKLVRANEEVFKSSGVGVFLIPSNLKEARELLPARKSRLLDVRRQAPIRRRLGVPAVGRP